MEQRICPTCGKVAEITAQNCAGCGHQYRTQFQPMQSAVTVAVPHATSIYQPPAFVAPAAREVSPVVTFFFGFFYFAVSGWWKSALAALLAAVLTGGLAWLIIPFFAKSFVDACEGIGTGGSPPNAGASLEQLADLHRRGIITQSEFDAKRAELLRRM